MRRLIAHSRALPLLRAIGLVFFVVLAVWAFVFTPTSAPPPSEHLTVTPPAARAQSRVEHAGTRR